MNRDDEDHQDNPTPDSTPASRSDLGELVRTEAFRKIVQPFADEIAKVVQPYGQAMARSITSRLEAVCIDIVQQLTPKVSVSSLWASSISEALQPALTRWLEAVQPAFASFREWAKERLPPNWDGADVKYDRIEEILFTDGIPIVWVPRAEVLSKVMACETRDDRITVLMERRHDVRADCLDCLSPVDSPDLRE